MTKGKIIVDAQELDDLISGMLLLQKVHRYELLCTLHSATVGALLVRLADHQKEILRARDEFQESTEFAVGIQEIADATWIELEKRRT